jgi:hypothetical protein
LHEEAEHDRPALEAALQLLAEEVGAALARLVGGREASPASGLQ